MIELLVYVSVNQVGVMFGGSIYIPGKLSLMFLFALDSLGNVSSPYILHQVITTGSSVWNEHTERARHSVGC